MLGVTLFIVGYGPSDYTLQGVRRTINALGPNYYNGAYQGSFGLIFNFFSINGLINSSYPYRSAYEGDREFIDGVYSLVDRFGLGIGYKYLEMALGWSYHFEAWDKTAYTGRTYADNLHTYGPGDGYAAAKIMLPLHGKDMSVSLGGSFIYTLPKISGIKLASLRDSSKDHYVSDSRGWYQEGGIFRTFTYEDPTWEARFLLTFLPSNKYIELNFNYGYSPRNPNDSLDDVTLLGSSLIFHLQSFHPFVELLLEDWRKGHDAYGDSPLYLTGGFNIELGSGTMLNIGIEKIFWYDGSTVKSERSGAPSLPEYVRTDPNAPPDHNTNIMTLPNWWFVTWTPQVGAWLALSYTFVPPYEKKIEKEKVKPSPSYIAGVVMDSRTQRMVGGAKVILKEKDISVITGDDGAYKFENLEPGSYTVMVQAQGYAPVSAVVALEAGKPAIKNFELKPVKTYAIIGTVYDKETNTPIGGAKVLIKESGDSVITQDDGVYRFPNVMEGVYTLIFAAPGYSTFSTTVAVEGGTVTKDAYLVKSKEKVQKVEKPGSITGVVRDAKSGAPLGAVQIVLKEKNITYTTDQSGAFRFDSLPEGTYTLYFSREGYTARTEIANVGAGSATVLNVALSPVEKKVQKVEKPGSITGVVMDAKSGAPLGAVQIVLKEKNITYTTDQSGSFRFDSLPEGTYTLYFSREGYTARTEIANVGAGSATVLNVALSPVEKEVGAVLITVVDKGSKSPISGAKVSFLTGNVGTFETDESGSVIVKDLPAGTYKIRVLYSKYIPQEKTVLVEKGRTKEVTFELVKKGTEITFRNIYFDLNKATLKQDAYPALRQICEFLKENPTAIIEIQGHTDERGSDKYNLRLSQARSESVRQWLINNGCATPDRLIARGYGESMPVVKNAKTEAEHALNRRVVIKVLGEKK